MEQFDDPAVVARLIYLGAVVAVTWLVLYPVIYLVFRGKDAKTKRRMVPVWAILACAISTAGAVGVGAFLSWSSEGIAISGVITLLSIVATVGNIRNLKFCDACGATRYELSVGPRLPSCPKCGTSVVSWKFVALARA